MTASRDIRIGTLKLQNDKHTLSVSVTHDKRRGGIYLQIICVNGGMYQLMGGPKGAYVLLEPRERFNAPALERWAKAFAGGPSEHEIYATAVNSVCEANGYVLATNDEDAYKPETFVRGQRVTIGKDPALIVAVGGIGRISGKQEYDLVLDSNWYWTGREADGHGMDIKAIEGEPILDEEAVDRRFAECQAAIAEREAEKQRSADAKQAETDAAVRELKAKYPWAKPGAASANLKTELEQAFPGVQFSVRQESHSSIRVQWTDGPTETQVNEIGEKYQYYSHMDNSDMTHNKQGAYNDAVSIVLGQSKYVSASRRVSDEIVKIVRPALLERFEAASDDHDDHFGAYRVLNRSEITGKFTGLGENEKGETIAIFEKPERCDSPYCKHEPRHSGPCEVESTAITAKSSGDGITVRENTEKGGVEVKFAAKPDGSVIEGLKRNGFRWSKFQKIWWAKANDRTRSYANGLIDDKPLSGGAGAAFVPDYFDMQVEDNMAMACGV